MVFVGMQGWGVAELLKDIELDPLTYDMILCLNHVNDTELRKLYEASLFCVFPSLYEGWGLPVGEALSLGKAVLCSNRGSLPEVGKNLVHYVDPWSPQDWADAIYRMSTDTDWREECIARVRTNYVSRTWKGAAFEIKKQLDKMLHES
jgi:glycosyltransferase involved in cell wall biosynthesis